MSAPMRTTVDMPMVFTSTRRAKAARSQSWMATWAGFLGSYFETSSPRKSKRFWVDSLRLVTCTSSVRSWKKLTEEAKSIIAGGTGMMMPLAA